MSDPNKIPILADDYFRQIAETAWDAGVNSEIIQQYAAIGDVTGLRYATKCLIACTKATAGTLADLIREIERAP
jgi:hypothetical protein